MAAFILFRATCTFFIFFPLLGCSFSPKLPRIDSFITASETESQLNIFWVDLLDGQPHVLTSLSLRDWKVLSKTEYRWQEGVIREIEFATIESSNEVANSRRYLIRYDSSGEAVYQSNYIDEELRPIQMSELKRIHQEADVLLTEVETLQKMNQHFFQGHFKNYEFNACGTDSSTWLKMNLPSDVILNLISMDKSYYIAALGDEKSNAIRVNEVLVFDEGNACYERPSFL